jgi:F-type H+-transporting ATPase subunit gamma
MSIYKGLEQVPRSSEAGDIGDKMTVLFLSAEMDWVQLIDTKFVSLIASRPVVQTTLRYRW